MRAHLEVGARHEMVLPRLKSCQRYLCAHMDRNEWMQMDECWNDAARALSEVGFRTQARTRAGGNARIISCQLFIDAAWSIVLRVAFEKLGDFALAARFYRDEAARVECPCARKTAVSSGSFALLPRHAAQQRRCVIKRPPHEAARR